MLRSLAVGVEKASNWADTCVRRVSGMREQKGEQILSAGERLE